MTEASQPIGGRMAVLGAGTIGLSWSALFLAHGLDVAIWDPDPMLAHRAQKLLGRQVQDARRLARRQAPAGYWSIAASPAAAADGAHFIQESGPEDLGAKRRLYSEIQPVLEPDAIIASSTSTIMPSALQEAFPFAERVVVGHPVNPPHLIPLVEVVGGRQTSEWVIERTIAHYQWLGKHPVRLRSERPGHLVNRIQAALWREAVDAVATDLASVADVDAVLTHALAPRWALLGPHATFHLGGGSGGLQHFIDHLGPAFVGLWNDLKQPELSSDVVAKLIAGVSSELGAREISSIADERDEKLLKLLTAIRPIAEAPPAT